MSALTDAELATIDAVEYDEAGWAIPERTNGKFSAGLHRGI